MSMAGADLNLFCEIIYSDCLLMRTMQVSVLTTSELYTLKWVHFMVCELYFTKYVEGKKKEAGAASLL